jgi:hypothetical protein
MSFSEAQRLRSCTRENNLAAWTDHLDFLLRFAQMMRARSLLFFEQQHEMWKNTPTWKVKEVLPDGKSLKLESMTPSPPPDDFIRNRTIIEMQAEIKKGEAWANDYHWALQYTDTPDEPFIISESPFVSTTDHPPRLLLLPISWRACLYGTLEDYGSEARRVDIENLRQIQSMYRRGAKLISCRRRNWMIFSEGGRSFRSNSNAIHSAANLGR